MKITKVAYTILTVLTLAIISNSIMIGHITENLKDEIESIDQSDIESALPKYRKSLKNFEKAEKYISLTVSHDDLTNIEESYAELIGAAIAMDDTGVQKAKSRLVDALEHLGRLSGINIDSIL